MPASCWEMVSTQGERLSWARSADSGCKDTLRLGTHWELLAPWLEGDTVFMKPDLY